MSSRSKPASLMHKAMPKMQRLTAQLAMSTPRRVRSTRKRRERPRLTPQKQLPRTSTTSKGRKRSWLSYPWWELMSIA